MIFRKHHEIIGSRRRYIHATTPSDECSMLSFRIKTQPFFTLKVFTKNTACSDHTIGKTSSGFKQISGRYYGACISIQPDP
jgi:hypothetical protein